MQKPFLGTNNCGQATPVKITPTKNFTEKSATVIMVGCYHPQKFILQKFNPPNSATVKISTFTVMYKATCTCIYITTTVLQLMCSIVKI